MSEYPSTETLRREANAWACSHATQIHSALKNQYTKTLVKTGATSYSSLSELGLCNALYNINLPRGFIIPFFGKVTVYDPYDSGRLITSSSHAFGINDNFVICITPGQFFDFQFPNHNLTAGNRIIAYQQIAPTLLTTFNTGVAVLHGTTVEIMDQLKLNYE